MEAPLYSCFLSAKFIPIDPITLYFLITYANSFQFNLSYQLHLPLKLIKTTPPPFPQQLECQVSPFK